MSMDGAIEAFAVQGYLLAFESNGELGVNPVVNPVSAGGFIWLAAADARAFAEWILERTAPRAKGLEPLR